VVWWKYAVRSTIIATTKANYVVLNFNDSQSLTGLFTLQTRNDIVDYKHLVGETKREKVMGEKEADL